MTLKVTLGTSLEVQCLGKSSPQCRGRGFNPWFGKIPRAVGQLSSCSPCSRAHELQILSPHAATTAISTKPEHPEAMLHDERGHTVRSPSPPANSSLRSRLEKACEQQRRPSVAKKNKEVINIITFQIFEKYQIRSDQSLSRVRLFATP